MTDKRFAGIRPDTSTSRGIRPDRPGLKREETVRLILTRSEFNLLIASLTKATHTAELDSVRDRLYNLMTKIQAQVNAR